MTLGFYILETTWTSKRYFVVFNFLLSLGVLKIYVLFSDQNLFIKSVTKSEEFFTNNVTRAVYKRKKDKILPWGIYRCFSGWFIFISDSVFNFKNVRIHEISHKTISSSEFVLNREILRETISHNISYRCILYFMLCTKNDHYF